jgi:hypothetical protein
VDNALVATNLFTTKSLANIEARFVSLEDLAAMTSDCNAIYLSLQLVMNSDIFRGSIPAEMTRGELRQKLSEPWRYKPLGPALQTKLSPKDVPIFQPRPGPFRA